MYRFDLKDEEEMTIYESCHLSTITQKRTNISRKDLASFFAKGSLSMYTHGVRYIKKLP